MTTKEAAVTCRSEEDEDVLTSKLPSELLLCILDKLELRDAVRVRVLSQRWRSLSHQLPNLRLNFKARALHLPRLVALPTYEAHVLWLCPTPRHRHLVQRARHW